MLPIESLNLKAPQWSFLSKSERYCNASKERKLVPESTRRQFNTARDILERLNGRSPQRGVLLADDAGLGKTTVAALVAWVVARAGEKRTVRILAPNDVMVRRWEEELKSHVEPLSNVAFQLGAQVSQVKIGRVSKLSAGSIQVVKHSYAASDLNLKCDLLIVDEAHRAKGENTAFSAALKRQKKMAHRILILTATPFSIQIEELNRMLRLIGGGDACASVKKFSDSLNALYSGSTAKDAKATGIQLAGKAQSAVEALKPFVIRHGIDDLTGEKKSFGDQKTWNGVESPTASSEALELMLRVDRALRIAKNHGVEGVKATNDPRFHVGWRQLDNEVAELKNGKLENLPDEAKLLVERQIGAITKLRDKIGTHAKMEAVSQIVKRVVDRRGEEGGEKVVLFCHHHATAQELTICLDQALKPTKVMPTLEQDTWKEAWRKVLGDLVLPQRIQNLSPPQQGRANQLREVFIGWLCEDMIRAQTASWFRSTPTSEKSLVRALEKTKSRCAGAETVGDAAKRLFHALFESRSSSRVLLKAKEEKEKGNKHPYKYIPGGNGSSHVLGYCERSDNPKEEHLFRHNNQPDTLISIFNSPFGPDVLVVTDKLSEGIDLHRYCRHLVHYELDPSPIRTIQRNGRIRRVNSWAANTKRPIQYAYPAFGGTRDQQLVKIMSKRISGFSLLLGGIQDINLDTASEADENWRNEVIKAAQNKLVKSNLSLRAKSYRTE